MLERGEGSGQVITYNPPQERSPTNHQLCSIGPLALSSPTGDLLADPKWFILSGFFLLFTRTDVHPLVSQIKYNEMGNLLSY